ncbi:MAG: response regulator [Planctomycetes bacterium]|nr:response regulator [Planctomycetota bacterium]
MDNTQIEYKKYSAKALVAEDNPANQMLIKILLQKHGIESTLVDNGQKAVEATKGQDFDVVFMDMQMPVMNGYEATQALLQDGFKTPIIALTANAMSGDREKCLETGCNDYLSKPIDRDLLMEILEKWLGSKNLDDQVEQVHEQAQELNQLVDETTPTEPQSILKEEQL